MIKAVIFDMDGVLVDTEPLAEHHRISYHKKMGHNLKEDFFETHRETLRGITSRRYWEFMSEYVKLEKSIDEMIKHISKDYLQFLMSLPSIKANPGVVGLIKRLKKEKIRVAIASSASLKRIKALMKKSEIGNKFEVIVSGPDVKNSKPAPDIYLKAAELLKLRPNECIAIEDAPNGIESAKKAGMKAIGYKGALHNEMDLSKADLVVKSFDEINAGYLDKI